ncbi:MAG: NFACT RNA binding domain-containing protein [Balneolaceae bacterium]|nr:NFACT RNA binding domain-containing protein [Balneolaceae bacterium]
MLELYLEAGGERHRLIFSANPSETAIFLDDYRPPKKSNVMDFFGELEGRRVEGTRLAEEDRLWEVRFEGEYSLLFKLYGGSPNVYLTDGKEILDAFKNPEEVRGEAPPEAHPPDRDEEPRMRAIPKNRLTGLHPKLPRNLLPHLVEQHAVDGMDAAETVAFGERIVRAMKEKPCPRVLQTGDLTLWDEELLDLPTDRAFDSVNDAVRHAYRNAVHLRRLNNRREKVSRFLERMESKKASRLEQLRQADRSLERADTYERSAHLLMAHAHEELEPRLETGEGETVVRLPDIYEEDREISIAVDPNRGFSGNAEQYYEKARSARRNYEEARRRIPRVERELEAVRRLREELGKVTHLGEMQDWFGERREKLEELGFGNESGEVASSPYRKLKVGKYEVWVGKSARSNDQLTSLAHKEDVWLHARGVPGSHVVIRMGNTSDYPPQEVILQAAGFAAWFSKAQGMKSAPVMYTKRKYVRKPKGAGPGAVKVEREQVVMVPPVEPRAQHRR